ncbi:MAG TPA: DSD1 family PLP-dependent enzyme [Nitrospirota bacterium]|nr:DSD1 family PLP-dependent enzyme [Nitrospirota bacterium]
MDLSELETPLLILDKRKLETNISTMRDHMVQLGIPMRPHGKTAKCFDIVRLALKGQPGGITVSTLKEAEYYFEHGITDIIYAVGIAPIKLEHVAKLRKRGADISIILDTVEQAKIAAVYGRKFGTVFPALIEIDSDGHRSGVRPGDPLLIEIGQTLQSESGVELKGVLTHAGGSYNSKTKEDIQNFAIQERKAATSCAQQLRNRGLPCPIVSIGSTPTVNFDEDLLGVTEVRAGVYMFYDLVMAGLGVCSFDDIALSVLASVIGYQKKKGWIITDAGWMALSRDRGTANQALDQGYGLVCHTDGRPRTDYIVGAVNQEHGIIHKRDGGKINFEDYPIGSTLRILPNHACATAAMHDKYYVINGSTEVITTWHRINGW